MKKSYGLIGYPLGHSFSQNFFRKKFNDEHIDADYINFEIATIDMLPSVIETHPDLCGFNVTIPYKQAIIPYLDSLDSRAEAIGAVNVVKINRLSGGRARLTGYNSDIVGFENAISPLLPKLSTPLDALVLGTGGASRAIVAGLKELGINPTLVSRSPAPGQLSYSDLSALVIARHPVIVNTTPLGMFPKVNACPDIPYQYLSTGHLCFDLVYNPLETTFMKRAREHGATVANGLAMLHGQAIEAWRIWNSNQ